MLEDFGQGCLVEVVDTDRFEQRYHAAMANAADKFVVAETLLACLRLAEAGRLFADYAMEKRALPGLDEIGFYIAAQCAIAFAQTVEDVRTAGLRHGFNRLKHIVDPLPAFGSHCEEVLHIILDAPPVGTPACGRPWKAVKRGGGQKLGD